jgi:hypothetical protein
LYLREAVVVVVAEVVILHVIKKTVATLNIKTNRPKNQKICPTPSPNRLKINTRKLLRGIKVNLTIPWTLTSFNPSPKKRTKEIAFSSARMDKIQRRKRPIWDGLNNKSTLMKALLNTSSMNQLLQLGLLG